VTLPGGQALASVREPRGNDYDLAVIHTLHPGVDYAWVTDSPQVLDATYQFEGAPHRLVV